MNFYEYKVTSYEIIDLDSIRVTLDFGWSCSLTQIARLYGLDAPEKGYKDITAKLVAWLDNRLKTALDKGKQIWVRSEGLDKFSGRFLATLYVDNDNINNEILRLGYAKPYFGESKKGLWEEEDITKLRDILGV